MDDLRDCFTLEETATLLRVSRRTMYRWANATPPILEYFQVGRRYYFHPDEIRRFIQSRGEEK
jgi:excisionase family DNA binding protein